MPLTARGSSRRKRRRKAAEEQPEPAETPAEVMAPTRMKLRRRDNAAAGPSGGGDGPGVETRGATRTSSRRKNKAAAASSSSLRAAIAVEETSPDSKCPICLDRFNNLAYLDRCLHRFCFPCIQEWSHNKAECPLCKQPFSSILHSVRAEDDFKEYTPQPAPPHSSVAATVAMVAAMAARSDHHMRLMLRRHQAEDGRETATRRRRRERAARAGAAEDRTGLWEWYLGSRHLPVTPSPPSTALLNFSTTSERARRRHVNLLAARQRLKRQRLAYRRTLYRHGIRVRGVAGVTGLEGQRDITAESFRQNPAHLNRLRRWVRRELKVLYGAHATLVDIVQRIVMERMACHGLDDTAAMEEELRPFLLGRTEHFLHELLSFARSPLAMDSYDMQAEYEPLPGTLELDGLSSSSNSSSVIAISEEEGDRGGRSLGASDDVIQSGSCLSQSGWDDETPGPSYSTAEPSPQHNSFSPAHQEPPNEEPARTGEEEGEECEIVGYKKPIAERTPELVQLSSDSEEEEQKKEAEPEEKSAPPTTCTPPAPPSTSTDCKEVPEAQRTSEGAAACRVRSWSGSSEGSRSSLRSLSPATPPWRGPGGASREGKSACRERRTKSQRGGCGRKSGTLCNPNRSIYPPMLRRCSPLSSSDSSPDPTWELRGAQVSPLSSLVSTPSCSSSSSPLCSSPPPRTPPTPTLSPAERPHQAEKPGGKRKYKSRHLDADAKDPSWRPKGGKNSRKKKKKRSQREESKWATDSVQSRRSREERSPSVEIIYEGVASSTQTPLRRRRKRQRRTQLSSPPVIITLDSDSSPGPAHNSASSSPLSSQQTVDFSDLPPLSLAHSAGVGRALDVGELPANILDPGSEGSDPELAGRSQSRIDIQSESDVDVEKVEGAGEDGPITAADTEGADTSRAPTPKAEPDGTGPGGSGVLSPPLIPLSPTIPPPPTDTDSKCRDAPPLPKWAGPIQPHSRNTPPPLKHKDAGCPQWPPLSPSKTRPSEPPLLGEGPTIPHFVTLKRPPLKAGLGPHTQPLPSCGSDPSPPSSEKTSSSSYDPPLSVYPSPSFRLHSPPHTDSTSTVLHPPSCAAAVGGDFLSGVTCRPVLAPPTNCLPAPKGEELSEMLSRLRSVLNAPDPHPVSPRPPYGTPSPAYNADQPQDRNSPDPPADFRLDRLLNHTALMPPTSDPHPLPRKFRAEADTSPPHRLPDALRQSEPS
ncbi:E3 ubiquitin-protein ligase Topors-like isoform X1 [Oryzias latipes]|uniref:E3 ubiquitin-protein ligase Topors-like isoform X1 n=1 Tax=Oryzias latipes TaxID=8090 RepID=UPI000CE271E6|nr:E3 ubiquitin-protein ligase Topors-like isoform X1 [Oryzias latipes]